MATHNSSGSDPVTPSDSTHAKINGNGVSSNGNQPTQGAIADAGGKPKTTITVSPASAAPSSGNVSQRWLVVALLLTSVAAGLGGAGLGWAIRHQSQNSQAGDPPALLDPFVNNEQSFPPLEGWAGDDPVERYAPEVFSEEVLPESLPPTEPMQERWLRESTPIQTRRSIEEDFVDPLSLPPTEENAAEWNPPDTVPAEPPAEFSQPPEASSFPPEPVAPIAPEPPPPAEAPVPSDSIRKTKPSAAIPEEPPLQTQSAETPVGSAPFSPPMP
jgi:hypothetical protein